MKTLTARRMTKARILWAHVRCTCFQLWMIFRHGLWYREFELSAENDRVVLIAAAIGMVGDAGWKIDVVFYNETSVADSDWCSHEAAMDLRNFMWRVK